MIGEGLLANKLFPTLHFDGVTIKQDGHRRAGQWLAFHTMFLEHCFDEKQPVAILTLIVFWGLLIP